MNFSLFLERGARGEFPRNENFTTKRSLSPYKLIPHPLPHTYRDSENLEKYSAKANHFSQAFRKEGASSACMRFVLFVYLD